MARYSGAGVLQDEYVWDGAQQVASLSSTGGRKWTAYWGEGLDDLVSVSVGTDEWLAVHDGRGSVGALYSAVNGRLAAAADYTPEGRRTANTVGGMHAPRVCSPLCWRVPTTQSSEAE